MLPGFAIGDVAGRWSIVPGTVCVGLVEVGVRWSKVPGLVVGLAGFCGCTVVWFMVPPRWGSEGEIWAEAAVAVNNSAAAASREHFIVKEVWL
jgi:hypothetical protein